MTDDRTLLERAAKAAGIEPAAYIVTEPVDVGVGIDHDVVLKWEPDFHGAPSEPLYEWSAVRELVALELERLANEPPINGNNLAHARVLLCAGFVRAAAMAPTGEPK
jgi:hypothetical protein